jgi:hypothetical protein
LDSVTAIAFVVWVPYNYIVKSALSARKTAN